MRTSKWTTLFFVLISVTSLFIFASCSAPSYHTPSTYRSRLKNTDALTDYAKSFIGTPYQYGGINRSGMDCSGFVIRVYGDVFGRRLPHNSKALFKLGKSISPAHLQTGDLVFFRGRQNLQISHVGIFLYGKTFIHASSSNGVILSKLGEKYYIKRYAGARRLF